jgi:hypothetical protein
LLADEISRTSYKGELLYTEVATAMRPLTEDHYAIVAFGYASENLHAPYHGAMGVCSNGYEDEVGAILGKAINKDMRFYIDLWELKHGVEHASNITQTSITITPVPEKDDVDIS